MSPPSVPEPELVTSRASPVVMEEEGLVETRPPRSGWQSTFRSLRHRNYRLYFLGQLVSVTGSWMQTTALGWVAFNLTKESKWPAWVLASQVLPTFLLGVWGGSLADRWPKRNILYVTQSTFLVLSLVMAALVLAGVANPWHLLLLTCATGIVQAVDMPTRLAFVMDMVGREDLMNAVALNSLLFNVARVIGPALAGWMFVLLNPGYCFVANAFSFLALIVGLAYMNISSSQSEKRGKEGASIRDGLYHLIRWPGLGFLVLLAGALTVVAWPFLVLLPALADKTLLAGKEGYSMLLSATGVGALMGAFLVASWATLARYRLLIGIGVWVVCFALLGLSFADSLPKAMLCCSFVGFGLILFFTTSQAVVQLSAGKHNRGLIIGIWAMVLNGALPLGNLLAGPAADHWGEPRVIGWMGTGCIGVAVGVLVLIHFWKKGIGAA